MFLPATEAAPRLPPVGVFRVGLDAPDARMLCCMLNEPGGLAAPATTALPLALLPALFDLAGLDILLSIDITCRLPGVVMQLAACAVLGLTGTSITPPIPAPVSAGILTGVLLGA